MLVCLTPWNFSLPHECIYCTFFFKAITKIQIYIVKINEIVPHPTVSIYISLTYTMLAQNEITAIVPGIFKTLPRGSEDFKEHHIKATIIYSSVFNRWLK